MDRRSLIIATLTAALPLSGALGQTLSATRWRVRTSESFDAIAFLGPLSGRELYEPYYRTEVAAFGAKLPRDILSDIATLWESAEKEGVGLLWPSLAVIMPGAELSTLNDLIGSLADADVALKPGFRASQYWDADTWNWLTSNVLRLRRVFAAMQDAGFSKFWANVNGEMHARVGDVQRTLSGYDVIKWQRKLTGRAFDPVIDIVLMRFSKPHGVKVQGQAFLQAADYDIATTVRIAAHEMLHPPVAMDGPAAEAALRAFANDSLIQRVVRDHDPRWGYTTLKGLLNEDICQALDQLIGEALGVARNPADRWRKSDDGIHIIAGGLYGLLRRDRWTDTGGSIEDWLASVANKGLLAPENFHPVAAQILERPTGQLWPLAKAQLR